MTDIVSQDRNERFEFETADLEFIVRVKYTTEMDGSFSIEGIERTINHALKAYSDLGPVEVLKVIENVTEARLVFISAG